jgi:SAM-dependent methyltransferase
MQAAGRVFLRCSRCLLTFVRRDQRPTPLAETLRYLHHHDDPHHDGHLAFLANAVEPLLDRLKPGAHGLDYGAGRSQALGRLLGERGFPTRGYDPCFAPDESALTDRYDFVTCTEVAEHFHEPRRELERLASLLKPGGRLGLTTRLLTCDDQFATWWYARDVTHVSFYRAETLAWIAAWRGWELECLVGDSAVFRSAN